MKIYGAVESLEDELLKYVINKYPSQMFPKVLEVATGKTCSFAQKLKQNGYRVTAIDPDVRIPPKDKRVKGIKILKRKFTPDFNIDAYDIVLGYNACPIAATLLKITNKPTVFSICDGPETDGKLDIGKEISSKREFKDELVQIGGCIKQVGNLTIVDNSRVLNIKKEELDKSDIER